MKSFSEYIKEAYSFRLGGSQKKGFEQTKQKAFKELEQDEFVFKFDTDDRIKDATIKAWMVGAFYFSHKGGWKDFLTNHNKMKNSKCEHFTSYITTSLQDAEDEFKKIYKKYPEVVKVNISNNPKEKTMTIEEFKTKFAANINEAYSFRLGGSQKKGFSKSGNGKNFNELKSGDIYYWWFGDKQIAQFTFRELKKNSKTGHASLSNYEETDSDGCTIDLSEINSNLWIVGDLSQCQVRGDKIIGYAYACSTDLNLLIDAVRKRFAMDLSEDDVTIGFDK